MSKLSRQDGRPLYRQLEAILEHEIESGQYAIGDIISSERKLCRCHEVSHTTVRRAIGELVKKGLLHKKHGKGIYVVNSTLEENKNIGVLIFNTQSITGPYFSRIIRGAEAAGDRLGYNIQLYPTNGKSLWEEKNSLLRHLILAGKVKGLLLVAPLPEQDVTFLLEQTVPLVAVNEYKRARCNCVVADFRQSAYELTRHLLQLGHKRIGLLIRPFETREHSHVRVSDEMLAGYKDALASSGMSFDEDMIAESLFDEEEAKERTRKLLELSTPPTAIVAAGNIFLTSVMKVAEERDLKVSEDISVVGLVEEGFDPSLTVMSVPTTRLGEVAIHCIIRMIKGERLAESKVLLPCTFSQGQSSGSAHRNDMILQNPGISRTLLL